MSKYNESYIINEYYSGRTTKDIADELGTYNTTIRRILLRNNVQLRSIKEVNTHIHVCPLKDNDPNSNYFLGLMLTDGCIVHRKNTNSASIQLGLKDEELVTKFRDFICPNNKVSKVLQKRFNTFMYQTSVRSDLIADWFESRGNFKNKSSDCDIYVPLNWDILRGAFDGDGYWHRTNSGSTLLWGICGKSEIFINKIFDFLMQNNIHAHIRKTLYKSGYFYYVEVGKTCDVVKLACKMYENANTYLERKYSIWGLFVEKLKEKFPKFKEGTGNPNPEPSRFSGRFKTEGAETIMEYLNTYCA